MNDFAGPATAMLPLIVGQNWGAPKHVYAIQTSLRTVMYPFCP